MSRVLLVDDDINLLDVMRIFLTQNDFAVTAASSGNEAIEILQDNSFDLLITDLYMENGGGQQLINWCKEHRSSLKVLAVSGEKLDHIISALEVVGDGGIPTMAKPFSLAKLLEVVQGMLNNQFL